jgi:hypothetical protein
MVALLGDWGTGLDVALYEEAAACLSGHGDREAEVEVRAGPRLLGTQRMRLVAPDLATRVTALAPNLLSDFEVHLSRFLDHTSLRAVQWINLGREVVQFKTVSRKGR